MVLQQEQAEVVVGVRPMLLLPDTTGKRRCEAFIQDGFKNVDNVEVSVGERKVTFSVPAVVGTAYWAILRFMYTNHGRKVYYPEFCRGVAEIMIGSNEEKWKRFVERSVVPVLRKGKVGFQPAKRWEHRLCLNGRNLCRIGVQSKNSYGRRLLERGHVMRHATDLVGEKYFILDLKLTNENTSPAKRGRKKVIRIPVG